MSNTSGPKPPHAWADAAKLSQQNIQKDLQTAVDSAFKPHPNIYKKAIAVLIRYETDDLECGLLEKELGDVFAQLYGYEVKYCTIEPKPDPNFTVNGVLNKLEENGYTDDGCLVILVFSGHGERYKAKSGKEVLALGGSLDRSGNIRTKKLFWNSATALLHHVDADVLHLLDCCFAAEGYNGGAETIAATSMTESAAASLETSFTQALIRELRSAASRAGTVANLHGQMLRNRRAHKLEYTPFYAERPGRPSIVLRRMSDTSRAQQPTVSADAPRILITAHVEGTIDKKDIASVKKWLLSFVPDSVKGMDIKLEGVWQASSSVLLLSLPIEVWTQLRNDPAYTYVGVVNSSNMLLAEGIPESPAPLALRPASGPENTQPRPGFGSGSK